VATTTKKKKTTGSAGKDAPPSAKHGVAELARSADAAVAARGGQTAVVDRDDRREWGRSLRDEVPRAVHGEWAPAKDRPDPISLLEAQGESRVQDLLPIRYGRMSESPFGFYRGAAAVMAADLAGTATTKISVQLCGDGHLVNFGGFATPERRLIFDVNDFDETLPGPWEWDLERLGGSFAVAARAKGLDDTDGQNAVERVALTYADTLTHLASVPTLNAWYWSIDTDVVEGLVKTSGAKTKRLDTAIARAHAHDRLQAVAKLTKVVDGHRRIIDQLPLVGHVPGDDELGQITALFDNYRTCLPDDRKLLLDRFHLVDAARKVVGVGSVGTRCWIALLDGGHDDDPLILQVKEADPSVLETHLQPSVYRNHGRRVVEGQRLMQAASDMFLGWSSDPSGGTNYYWRQLRDMKISADINGQPLSAFLAYAELCGMTLARAHARSGDAAAISGYLGKGNEFAHALARFATTYADQNDLDHAALQQAIKDGRVHAEPGV
jgi:uncharacterized protein (DUF2252 family)